MLTSGIAPITRSSDSLQVLTGERRGNIADGESTSGPSIQSKARMVLCGLHAAMGVLRSEDGGASWKITTGWE